jgi:hypothetical protein
MNRIDDLGGDMIFVKSACKHLHSHSLQFNKQQVEMAISAHFSAN